MLAGQRTHWSEAHEQSQLAPPASPVVANACGGLPTTGIPHAPCCPIVLQGVAVFLAGNALQLQSHVLLSRLGGQRRGTTYFIPRGGAFELVSCPHYLAEIAIYCGLAMIAGPSRPLVLLIVVWVVRRDGGLWLYWAWPAGVTSIGAGCQPAAAL